MADLTIRTDIALRGLDNLIGAAGPKANLAFARALNRTGAPVSTAMRRKVREVLGLRNHPYAKRPLGDALRRNTSIRRATQASLTFSFAGFGKGLPLIYYRPKEGPPGATVHWLGERRLIERSFYLSGRFPRRKRSGISGTVYRRVGHGRWKLAQPKGPGVPEAMQTPEAARTWESQAAARLPHHLRSALEAVLRGY